MSQAQTNSRVSIEDYFVTHRAAIDRALEQQLPAPPTCPALISEVMRYSLFAGGKRLRPILTIASADTISQSSSVNTDLMATACAIEMIHTYSLIHDDLPSMDDDLLRRGQPTAHVAYGEGMAILAGDALLTEAFGLLSRIAVPGNTDACNRALRAIRCIAEAAGATGMVGGQVLDLQSTGISQQRDDRETLQTIHSKKTSALIRAATVTGAIVAGAREEAIKAIDTYASHFGLAFQIIDDVLDVEGASDKLGKTVGKDATTGKVTYPSLYGIDESKRLAAESISNARAALETFPRNSRLSEIAEWALKRTT